MYSVKVQCTSESKGGKVCVCVCSHTYTQRSKIRHMNTLPSLLSYSGGNIMHVKAKHFVGNVPILRRCGANDKNLVETMRLIFIGLQHTQDRDEDASKITVNQNRLAVSLGNLTVYLRKGQRLYRPFPHLCGWRDREQKKKIK